MTRVCRGRIRLNGSTSKTGRKRWKTVPARQPARTSIKRSCFYKVGENIIMKTDKTTKKTLKMCLGGAHGNKANEYRRRKARKCGSGGERVRAEGVFGMVRGENRRFSGRCAGKNRRFSEAESGRNGAATGEGALAQLFSSFFAFRSCNRSLKMIY